MVLKYSMRGDSRNAALLHGVCSREIAVLVWPSSVWESQVVAVVENEDLRKSEGA